MPKIGIAILTLAVACTGGAKRETVDVTIQGARGPLTIHAEVADTEVLRERGLMNRASLAADHGMLFVWPDSARREFYMKDTLIPLDLISIRAHRVVGVATMQPCRADPCPITRTPSADAALEVPAGTAERAGVSAGAPTTYMLPS